LWKNYDIEGNGMLDTAEARHFLDHHLNCDYGIERLMDQDFEAWFREIDKDGDGKIEIVEMALAV
jgi:Ca2+-binding EF-hand superfamily protein